MLIIFGVALCNCNGYSHCGVVKLLDLLTSQPNRELVSHNMIVAGLRRRVEGVIQKGRELLEASAKLREEKLDLEEKLLSRLLELQKAWKEVSDLQRKVISLQSQISSLPEQIDKGCAEKQALECESVC